MRLQQLIGCCFEATLRPQYWSFLRNESSVAGLKLLLCQICKLVDSHLIILHLFGVMQGDTEKIFYENIKSIGFFIGVAVVQLNQPFHLVNSSMAQISIGLESNYDPSRNKAKQNTAEMTNSETDVTTFMDKLISLGARSKIKQSRKMQKIYQDKSISIDILSFYLDRSCQNSANNKFFDLKQQNIVQNTKYVCSSMDLLRLTNKLSQTEFLPETSILRKSIRQTPGLIRVLLKLALRRQRYCFQLLKYFILFPSSSQMSETQSIDSYDRLIFGDDAVHSVVKIFETKQLQNMIWAFINIKTLKYLDDCKKFTNKMTKIYIEKRQKPVKIHAFQMMKQYDVKLQENGRTQRKNVNLNYVDQQTNTFHRQKLGTKANLYEVKIDGNNYFSSNIMIQSSESGQHKSIGQSKKFKIVQNAKLSQSHHLVQDMNQTQSQQEYPSKISLKSISSEQQKRQSNRQSLQPPSQTKIRFTYTSPTKQNLTNFTQQSQKTILKQAETHKRKDQYTSRYKYAVPKTFEDKKICCQNLCGIGCGDNCSINSCGFQ